MKNGIIIILASVVMMLSVFTSCEEGRYLTDIVKFELTVEAPEVKSFFSTGESQVKWGTGDIISVVDDKGNIHVSDPLAKAVLGEAVFTFSQWPSGSLPVYAIHSGAYDSYKPSDTYKNGIIHTSVEPVQAISRKNSFPRNSIIAVGTVVGNNGKFSVLLKNVCALVKISVENDKEYSSVRLEGSGSEDVLSGNIAIVPGNSPEDTPAVTVVEGSSSVTLAKEDGISAANYYLCVLPGTVTSPILTYYRKDGSSASLKYDGNVQFYSGKITDFSFLGGSWIEIEGVQTEEPESENISRDNQVKVCSYNVWGSGARRSRIEEGKDADGDGDRNYADKVHYWKTSKGYVADNIVSVSCDIYGLQECCDSIRTELPLLLSERGCELSSVYFGDNMIMWNDSRLEKVQSSHFSGKSFYFDENSELHIETARTCIWVRMRERNTGKEFLIFNTHGPLDDFINAEFAKEIVKKVEEINTEDLPVLVLGDFNAGDVSVREAEVGMMYDHFLGYWTDSYREAVRTYIMDGNELANPGTHVGYMDNSSYTRSLVHKIDHIFYDGLRIMDYYVSRRNFSMNSVIRYPSDHLPVCGSYIFEN